MLPMVLLVSCATQEPPPAATIATIQGDPQLAEHIEILFHENNIVGGAGGSVVYGIKVRNQDKDKAINLLRRDSAEKGYWIRFNGEESKAN